MPSKKKAVKVYLNDEEHQYLFQQAANAHLSMSTYAKRICLGYEPKSLVDKEAALALIRLRAELGRLGGLLKHELKEQRLARTPTVTAIINAIADNKDVIMDKVKDLGGK